VTIDSGAPSRTNPAVRTVGDAYAMGRSEAGTDRLIRQSGFYAPFTQRLFEQAGLGPGIRVLDVGTGAGDVALMAAEMVGASGSVVGVDHNPRCSILPERAPLGPARPMPRSSKGMQASWS
jgi:protein-L-isoaspartate O-methyltransferase